MGASITADAAIETPSETSNWRMLNGIAAAVFIGFVWTMSLPGIGRGSLLLALGGFVALAVWALYVIRLHRHPARVIDVAIVPLLVAALVVLAMWSLPLKARFATSKASFEHVASQLVPDTDGPNSSDTTSARLPQTIQPDGRIGSYDIKSVQWNSDDVFFYAQTSGSLGRHGFAYLPNGTDHHGGSDIFLTPVSGDWYEFTARF